MKVRLQPCLSRYTEVVRVAATNNFGCTPEEYKQLAGFIAEHPTKYFFVNSNVKTPKLLTLNDHEVQAVVTLNPDLDVDPALVGKFYHLNPARVAFVRVKWLPERDEIVELIDDLCENEYVTVITMQRFNSKKMLAKHTEFDHYEFSFCRYRLAGEALAKVEAYADSTPRVFICDREGQGCRGCGLCSTLAIGEHVRLSSLNLSSSGLCPFNCPDCYAKTMQNFLTKTGTKPIQFDVIKQNNKQAGRTKHIKHAKENA